MDCLTVIHCPELIDVENSTRDSNETYYDKRIIYSCLPGYQFPDKLKQKAVLCTENETWTDFPPPCEGFHSHTVLLTDSFLSNKMMSASLHLVFVFLVFFDSFALPGPSKRMFKNLDFRFVCLFKNLKNPQDF